MTTIACKDGCMAADTQLTGDYVYRAQKLVRLPNGGIAGGAGEWPRAYSALSWLANGEQGDPPAFKKAEVLILQPDGSLWLAEEAFPAYPLLDKAAAIGSGAQAAMLAMLGGASAVEAVKAVAKFEPNTSEPVQMLSIAPKPKRPRK